MCSFTDACYNSVSGIETYATIAKNVNATGNWSAKTDKKQIFQGLNFPKVPSQKIHDPPPKSYGKLGWWRPEQGLQHGLTGKSDWGKHVIDKSIYCRGEGKLCEVCIIHCSLRFLLPIFTQNVVKNSHLVWPYYTKRNKLKNLFLNSSV